MNIKKTLDEIKDKYANNEEILIKLMEVESLISSAPITEESIVEEIDELIAAGTINERLIELLKSINNPENIKNILKTLYYTSIRVQYDHMKYVLELYKYLIR